MPSNRNCQRCQRRHDLCTCGDPLTQAEADYGLAPFSLSVNSPDTPLGLGGYERPTHLVENTDEILARFREHNRPLIQCAYCWQGERFRAPTDALRWFRTHTCDGEGQQIAA